MTDQNEVTLEDIFYGAAIGGTCLAFGFAVAGPVTAAVAGAIGGVIGVEME